MREAKSFVNEFLRAHYGITWKEIGAKGRGTLLSDVEHVPCNLCGYDDSQPVAERDKYGLNLTTVICRNCGLLYLNERPTAESYRRFYEEGGQHGSFYHRKADLNVIDEVLRFYFGSDFVMDDDRRRALTRFMADNGIAEKGHSTKGRNAAEEPARAEIEQNELPNHLDASATRTRSESIDAYAAYIYHQLKDHVPRGGKVFEPGASDGKMLQPWKELHGCEATGVEPKKAAVREANERFGINLLQGFSDDPRIPENCYDLVFNTRTINHMLDPLGDLRHAWRWLKPHGLLFVDIQDAVVQARYGSFERKVVEIDHPYMFSLNTLAAMVQKAGFEIEQAEIQDRNELRIGRVRPDQIRILARKAIEPVLVKWPDPLLELATLFKAQVEYDRARDLKEQAQHRARQKKEPRAELPRKARAKIGLGRFQASEKAVRVLEQFGIRWR